MPPKKPHRPPHSSDAGQHQKPLHGHPAYSKQEPKAKQGRAERDEHDKGKGKGKAVPEVQPPGMFEETCVRW